MNVIAVMTLVLAVASTDMQDVLRLLVRILPPGFKHATCCSVKRHASSASSFNILKEHIHNSSQILVMAGAGLSTPSGIPDFRSPDTGLYYNLQKFDLPYPEAIFDLTYFSENPQPFITLAQELYPGAKYRPNIGHYFVRLLDEKDKLLRMYTQNIDGLEELSGLPEDKLVAAHGKFTTASCIKCHNKQDPVKTRELILAGEIVLCDDYRCNGLVKPDIVFFGEMLPSEFWQYEDDASVADTLIVIGTSLEVYPFANVAEAVNPDALRLLINRHAVGSFGDRENDIVLTGDIIENIKELSETLGWGEDLLELYSTCENNRS